MNYIYFDTSATTKPHREVIDEVIDCMEKYYGNPSSTHKLGLEAEKKLKTARERVASLIGAAPNEIYFTSGGSEANNMAIVGVLSKGDHIIASQIEHPSVIMLLKNLEKQGYDVTYISVDKNGIINREQLINSIRDNTRLITIMHVNNEIGSIQPIRDISLIIRERSKRIKLHVDAVQSLGKLPLNVKEIDVDMMSISAHKIHGPKGVGALYVKKGLALKPLIFGGGQEGNLRSGTENLPAISGFGIAAQMAGTDIQQKSEKVKILKSYFIKRLQELEKLTISSPIDEMHIHNILNVSFEGVRGEVLLHALEDYGIYVSTGSACSSRDIKHSNYVLPALGLKSSQIEGTIRFSFTDENTIEEIDIAIEALKKILPFLRRIRK